MTKPQEFTIQVQSEDPKKKEKRLDEKPDVAGSSNLLKDAKDGDGEELVRDCTIHILIIDLTMVSVGGGPAAERSTRNAS